MERKSTIVIDNSKDRIFIVPEDYEYVTGEEYLRMKVKKIIKIQAMARGYLARKRVKKLKEIREEKEKEEKEREKEREGDEKRRREKEREPPVSAPEFACPEAASATGNPNSWAPAAPPPNINSPVISKAESAVFFMFMPPSFKVCPSAGSVR